MRQVSLSDDRIDTRDVLERIAELEADEDRDNDEDYELAIWRELVAEAEDYSEDSAKDGVFLIAEHSFEDYAQELAEDIGAVGTDNQWPVYCIDWERAAKELAMDYSLISVGGYSFYVR